MAQGCATFTVIIDHEKTVKLFFDKRRVKRKQPRTEDPILVLLDAQAMLCGDGVPHNRSPIDARGAVLTAEAINWAAKTIDYGYYAQKPLVIDAAAQTPNVQSGWGDDCCFYMFTEEVGTVSFHDPYGQILSGGHWPYPWSGISRQELAFECLGDDALLARLAESTTPT